MEVSPGARRSAIIGIDAWRGILRINISSQPISGKANRELISMLDELFPEAKGRISIVKGEKSHRKRLFIPLGCQVIKGRIGGADDV